MLWKVVFDFTALDSGKLLSSPFFLLLLPTVFPVFLHNIASLPSTPFSFTFQPPLPSSGDLESQREPSRKICPHTLHIFLPVMGWIVSPLKCICCVPTPGTLGCGTYLEIESLQMQLVKMRSYWRRLGSHSKMTGIPKRGGNLDTSLCSERMPCACEDSHPHGRRMAWSRGCPPNPQKEPTQTTPYSQTSRFQNCKTIHSCC